MKCVWVYRPIQVCMGGGGVPSDHSYFITKLLSDILVAGSRPPKTFHVTPYRDRRGNLPVLKSLGRTGIPNYIDHT